MKSLVRLVGVLIIAAAFLMGCANFGKLQDLSGQVYLA